LTRIPRSGKEPFGQLDHLPYTSLRQRQDQRNGPPAPLRTRLQRCRVSCFQVRSVPIVSLVMHLYALACRVGQHALSSDAVSASDVVFMMRPTLVLYPCPVSATCKRSDPPAAD